MKSGNAGKDLYKQLRALPWEELWTEEVARFDRAMARERFDTVSVNRDAPCVPWRSPAARAR